MFDKTRVVLALALGLGACSPFGFLFRGGGEGTVSPNQLYANPERYEGREVSVRGYLVGLDCLRSSRDTSDRAQGVTLLEASPLVQGKEGRGGRITVHGVFDADHVDAAAGSSACGTAALIVSEAPARTRRFRR